MKRFFNSLSNKVKAIYILWFFIHFLLWMYSGFEIQKRYYELSNYKSFFPLGNISRYDISEFLLYTITPLVLTLVIYLFRKKDN
ncbi:MAG: hypothetical protein FJ214_10870 [Ignavibacteria bacterium]|nr:hypothetical protein [Ignavibacteria bacterium]